MHFRMLLWALGLATECDQPLSASTQVQGALSKNVNDCLAVLGAGGKRSCGVTTGGKNPTVPPNE